MTSAEIRRAERHVQGLELWGMRLGLERPRRLLAALGSPERCAPAVHVVGSNGKSSTSRLAGAAFASEGLRTGVYLSPHVQGWRERVEIGGRAISREGFARAVSAVREAADGLHLAPDDQVTQFELLTAAAFWAFARAGVEAMVIEAGLGGRHDATNVLGPETVVLLTNISLEHTDLLGNTEAEIAAEKLAVCPDGSGRLVIGRMAPSGAEAVRGVMAARGLTGWWLGREVRVRARGGAVTVTTPSGAYSDLPLPVRGRFQRDNLAVALAGVERRLGHRLDVRRLAASLARVRMPGRLEVLPGRPLVVLDGAHNPAGMEAMAASIRSAVGSRRPVAVVSVLGDKDAQAMIAALAGICRALVATRSRHPRAASPERLAGLAAARGMRAEAVEDAPEAVERARRLAGVRGAVLVTGSLYLLADLRAGLVQTARERPGEPAEGPATLAPDLGRGR